MIRTALRLFLGLIGAFVVSSAWAETPSDPLAPPMGIDPDTRTAYETGRLIFNGHWRPSGRSGPDDFEGLGPLYNRIACSSCHNAGGRGKPPSGPDQNFLTALVRIGVVDEDGQGAPHPVFGPQIQDRAVPGEKPEAVLSLSWEPVPGTYPDGNEYELRRPSLTITPDPGPDARWSIRVSPPLRGLGLLALAVGTNEQNGRFGWKAGQPTLALQNASALSQDMGITSRFFPDPVCPSGQETCGGGEDEVNGIRLMTLSLFTELLPAPEPLDVAADRKGEMLFMKIGCGSCHIPELPLRHSAETVRAFTDLALHRMGDGLDDGLPEGGARSDEWRTAPLWGLGTLLAENPEAPLLHDGRARGAEEAILWHDGEAKRSRQLFMALSKEDRAHLLAFLGGL